MPSGRYITEDKVLCYKSCSPLRTDKLNILSRVGDSRGASSTSHIFRSFSLSGSNLHTSGSDLVEAEKRFLRRTYRRGKRS